MGGGISLFGAGGVGANGDGAGGVGSNGRGLNGMGGGTISGPRGGGFAAFGFTAGLLGLNPPAAGLFVGGALGGCNCNAEARVACRSPNGSRNGSAGEVACTGVT